MTFLSLTFVMYDIRINSELRLEKSLTLSSINTELCRKLYTELMEEGSPINSQRFQVTREEGNPASWSTTLGGFHQVMNALMALLIGLEYAKGMENLITLLVDALVFYFGLMYTAKVLPAYDSDLSDIGTFINKISILFGIAALIFELLIIVIAYGSVPLFLWSICMVSVAVAVLVLVRLAFVELKEKLRECWERVYNGITVAAQSALELSMSTTKHETQDQDQNQIINELTV